MSRLLALRRVISGTLSWSLGISSTQRHTLHVGRLSWSRYTMHDLHFPRSIACRHNGSHMTVVAALLNAQYVDVNAIYVPHAGFNALIAAQFRVYSQYYGTMLSHRGRG